MHAFNCCLPRNHIQTVLVWKPDGESIEQGENKHKEGQTIKIPIWPTPKHVAEYPEMQVLGFLGFGTDSKNIGIAISGGGMRAASLTAGWLRGFNSKGVLDDTRYLSVTSGSSWVSMPLISAVADQIKTGKSQQKAFEHILADTPTTLSKAHFLKKVLLLELSTTRDVFTGKKSMKKNPWCSAVKEFTQMYHETDPFYSKLHEVFEGGGRDLPFLIVGGSVIVRKYFLYIPTEHAVPFEFTPMYCGIPLDPKQRIPGASGNLLPSGFVSPDGFNSKPVAHTHSSKEITVITGIPTYFSDVAGISSCYVAQKLFQMLMKSNFLLKVFETFVELSPGLIGMMFRRLTKKVRKILAPKYRIVGLDDKENLMSKTPVFADGGACDVTSVISLFRRKVRNVIICEAAEYDTINDVDPDCDSLRQSFKDIYCLFGQASEFGQPRGFNKMRQVFDNKELRSIMLELLQQRRDYKPMIVQRTLMVHENHFAGVLETYEANVLFVINSIVGEDWPGYEEYVAMLAATESVSDDILTASYDANSKFPYVSTFALEYDAKLTERMADISNWSIRNSPAVDTFMAKRR